MLHHASSELRCVPSKGDITPHPSSHSICITHHIIHYSMYLHQQAREILINAGINWGDWDWHNSGWVALSRSGRVNTADTGRWGKVQCSSRNPGISSTTTIYSILHTTTIIIVIIIVIVQSLGTPDWFNKVAQFIYGIIVGEESYYSGVDKIGGGPTLHYIPSNPPLISLYTTRHCSTHFSPSWLALMVVLGWLLGHIKNLRFVAVGTRPRLAGLGCL